MQFFTASLLTNSLLHGGARHSQNYAAAKTASINFHHHRKRVLSSSTFYLRFTVCHHFPRYTTCVSHHHTICQCWLRISPLWWCKSKSSSNFTNTCCVVRELGLVNVKGFFWERVTLGYNLYITHPYAGSTAVQLMMWVGVYDLEVYMTIIPSRSTPRYFKEFWAPKSCRVGL